MEVQILSQKLIKPSATTPTHDHNITFFDQLAPQLHLRLIFFYSSFESNAKIKNLQKSLSDTLNLYPPFAGRFKEDGLTISCGAHGVPFSKAKVNEKLDGFLLKANDDRTLLNAFVPQDLKEVKSVKTPMLAIQATSFNCGGLALGISRTHALADAYSAITFLHHWATIHRGMKEEIVIHLPEFHLAYDLFPSNMLTMKQQATIFMKFGNKKIVNKMLVFSEETILSLKAKMVSPGRISRMAIVMGIIWRALINISRAKNGYLRPSILSLTLNLRGRSTLTSKKTLSS